MDKPDYIDYQVKDNFFASFRDDIDGSRFNCEHSHDEIEFDLFIKADAILTLNGTIYRINDNSLLLMAAHDLHRFVHNPLSGYKRFVVSFTEQFIKDILPAFCSADYFSFLKEGTRVIPVAPDASMHIKRDFDILLYLQKDLAQNNSKMTLLMLKTTLLHILSEYKLGQQINRSRGKMTADKMRVQQIITFIDSNYSSGLSLDLISKSIFISKYYAESIFKKVTGYSIIEYVVRKRVNEAQKKLISTKMSVTSIAHTCGFTSLSSFYNSFKQISGCTPNKYRLKYHYSSDQQEQIRQLSE